MKIRDDQSTNATTMTETFSIQFSGEAFDGNEMPASALAQSLLALDALSRMSAEAAYGKGVEADIKVKAGFRKGVFMVDLSADRDSLSPDVAVGLIASGVTVGGVFGVLASLIKCARFALGRKLKTDGQTNEKGETKVTNCIGQVNYFDAQVVNIYNQGRTIANISRLSQTLDNEGAESIRIFKGDPDKASEEETITKQDREYFRQGEGVVLTDSETEVILDIVGPMLNGSPKGWRFSDGEVEFVANVEDEDYLASVRDGKIKFENGTSIRAVMRTVQRRTIRTVTDRTIVEVKETIPPGRGLLD